MGSLTPVENTEAPLWVPDRKTFSDLNIEIFRKAVNQKYGICLETYADLHKWSCTERAKFWEEVWNFSGVLHSESYSSVVDESVSIDRVPKWFLGARLNYAENLLEKGNHDSIAVYYKGEGHQQLEKLTFGQLRAEAGAWANALRESGVRKGDVVAGILPNCPQTLAALLGTAIIGATWTCTSPDYGITGVVERFKQTEPKVVISVNAVFYNGKTHSMTEKLEHITSELTTVTKVIVIPFMAAAGSGIPATCKNWVSSPEFLTPFRKLKTVIQYEQVPFDHPLFIMYSSGTTGKPKCMVHSVGGTLIKHLEEHVLQSDLKEKDTIFFFTTVGWMMYNWLITSLCTGCAIVLYDGSPSTALWNLIDEIGITIFGTSAKWLAVQEDVLVKNGTPEKRKTLDKTNTKLRMVLSTGSPLKPQSFDFVYNYVKKDVVLGSVCGGTDIIGCFMGQNVSIPVHRGEIQSYHLGCDLDCFDEEGRSVIGDRGELVVRTPFPSMPTHFHNDTDGVLYRKAYFAKFNEIWAHGDYMLINPETKGIIILGRSDATLNPNGVRFGSAEIYQVVEQFREVADSVCVAQKNITETDERVILFLRLSENCSFTDELATKIKKLIREQLSPRHVPAVIMPITDIPYTISGKKVEIAVRNVIEGQEVKNSGALANPSSLDLYKNIPQLAPWS